MNVTRDDATTVRTGLKTPIGIDVLDAVFGERITIGPHTARPYEDGSRRTCWKCVDCGETYAEYGLHRFLVVPCRDFLGTELVDWQDDPRGHAGDVEERIVKFDRSDRPWTGDAVAMGPLRRTMQVPADFERVDTGSRAAELDLDGGGRVCEWRKCPIYECPHCGQRFRGPEIVLASRRQYPDWARTPVDADPDAD